jgi:hypothetical protein
MTERGLSTADIAAGTQQDDGDGAAQPDATAAAGAGRLEPLLATDEGEGFRGRWTEIQTRFVDAPRESVEQADALVAELMQRLAQTFAQERQALEDQWSGGRDPSTEDLRVGLQRYRSFFERLLST